MAAAADADPAVEWSPLPAESLGAATALLFGDLPHEDVARWYEQGFVLNPPDAAPPPGELSLAFGLRQRSGGPCGMLAAVQGYMLYSLLFGSAGGSDGVPRAPLTSSRAVFSSPSVRAVFSSSVAAIHGSATCYASHQLNVGRDVLTAALIDALSFMLWQAGTTPERGGDATFAPHATVVAVEVQSILPLAAGHAAEGLRFAVCHSFPALQRCVRAMLPQLESDSGVILMLLSLMLTRGVQVVRRDMDEASALIARFGHSSQELLNLFLTGEAVSGIFDGEQRLESGGDDCGLTLRGITRQPLLGYLSKIEALRYGVVGDYFKTPLVPVWVVGSESHFTLLFGCDLGVNEASPSSHVYRAFKKYDVHDNQFIASEQLVHVLTDLGLPHVHDDAALASLKSTLDTGTGIIVWADFWHAVSPLVDALRPQPTPVAGAAPAPAAAASPAPAPAPAAVTFTSLRARVRSAFNSADTHGGGFIMGSDVQRVLRSAGLALATDATQASALAALVTRLCAGDAPAGAIVLYDDLDAALTTTLHAEAAAAAARSAPAPAAAGTKRPRSDSDVARDLQAQLDAESRPAHGGALPRNDLLLPAIDLSMFGAGSELDLGRASVTSTTAATGGLIAAAAPVAAPAPAPAATRSAYASPGVTRTFELYHYNGLYDRGRVPRCVRLILRQSDSGLPPVAAHGDAVSASAVAMNVEDETAAALAASALEAGNDDDAALAAALAASTQDAAGETGSTVSAAPTAASAPTGVARARSAELEAILRTKWPGVVLSCDGAPPSID